MMMMINCKSFLMDTISGVLFMLFPLLALTVSVWGRLTVKSSFQLVFQPPSFLSLLDPETLSNNRTGFGVTVNPLRTPSDGVRRVSGPAVAPPPGKQGHL